MDNSTCAVVWRRATCVQVGWVSWQFHVQPGEICPDNTGRRPVRERGAVRRQGRPVVKVQQLLSAHNQDYKLHIILQTMNTLDKIIE